MNNTISETGHELGKRYHCGYWGHNYTVIEIHDNDDVTIQKDDGEIIRHHTSLTKRDYQL